MAEPFIGEIRMFGGNFAPVGWALCNGQLLAISENQALFALIGTTYGGNGQTTFALPNLQSRLPVHQGTGGGLSSYLLGETGGVENITLAGSQIPAHGHPLFGSTDTATSQSPANALPATIPASASRAVYGPTPNTTMAPNAIAPAGSSQAHDNIQPYLCVNFIISLFGIFPSQN